MKYKAVVFDLDGTLLYTLEDLMDSVNFALAKYNLPQQSLAQIKSHVNHGVRWLVAQSVEGGEKYEHFEELFLTFKEHYAKNCCNKTKPYEGIVNVLETLKKAGVKTVVITNKFQSAAEDICRTYFPNLLTMVFGEVKGLAHKPAPDIVFKALSALKVPVEEAIMFGDSTIDEHTAQNAKIAHAAVLWGYASKEQLLAENAKIFAVKTSDIISMVIK